MKIAIDSAPLKSGHKVRGIGVNTRELVEALKQESLKRKNLKVEATDFSKTNLSQYDLIHYPYFHPYFLTTPLVKPAKKVILTIHDLIYLIYPKHYPPGIRGKLKFLLQKWIIKRNVDLILTISETSKKDIVRFLKVKPRKVAAVYLAPQSLIKLGKKVGQEQLRKAKQKYHLPDQFILYVGDVNYNKNIINLVKACKLAKTSLVICGKQAQEIENLGLGLDVLQGPRDWIRYLFGQPHPETTHYSRLLRLLRNNPEVICTGFVSDDEFIALFNLATVYCQPSLYEGFGLPVLEAMSLGLPVAASRTQALVEIAGESALYFNPKDPKDMSKKITQIIKNGQLRKKLIKSGYKRASEFSWQKTAQEILDLYLKVLDSNLKE